MGDYYLLGFLMPPFVKFWWWKTLCQINQMFIIGIHQEILGLTTSCASLKILNFLFYVCLNVDSLDKLVRYSALWNM